MLTILLVDDHVELLYLFTEKIVEELGAKVMTASSGNQAIEFLQQGKKVDFIISDYNMPDGSGRDLLLFTMKNTRQIYFLFFTSELNPDVSQVNAFFLGVVSKPEFKQIKTLIENCIKNDFNLRERTKKTN
jgi:CheY-like chemotaxis protein